MQASLSEALPLTATHNGVIQNMGNTIDINLCESAKAKKKQFHSLPYSVLRIWNDQCKHFKFGFTPDSNPKMCKRGKKIVIHLCKRTKVKITDMSYLRLLRVRTDQFKYL